MNADAQTFLKKSVDFGQGRIRDLSLELFLYDNLDINVSTYTHFMYTFLAYIYCIYYIYFGENEYFGIFFRDTEENYTWIYIFCYVNVSNAQNLANNG